MKNTGKITKIMGPVVDVVFDDGKLPNIYEALEVKKDKETIILEVAQHLGLNEVRSVSMSSTDGLFRGQEVYSTGAPISVPVGPETLGRMFNVTGDPIDEKPAPKTAKKYPIHRKTYLEHMQWSTGPMH
jgi:F-type H+-transporting ATPase subunit beta